MAARTHFKRDDRVTVFNVLSSGPAKGRVICANRVSLYEEEIVVLVDAGRQEIVETFKQDGHRWLPGSTAWIALGWPAKPDLNLKETDGGKKKK